VKRSTTGGGPYTTITTTSATNFTDTIVAIGSTYFYVASALDQFCQSTNSLPASASLVDLGYQLSATPSSQIVIGGDAITFNGNMTTNSDFNGSVTFVAGALPVGVTASFSPTALDQPGSTTLTIQTTSNIFSGTYLLTIAGINGAFTVTTNVTLI